MNTKKFRTLSNEKVLYFNNAVGCLFVDKSCDELKDLTDIWIINQLECMAHNRGITDFRDYSGIATEITHALESEMMDYIEYNLNNEYGPDEEEKKCLCRMSFWQQYRH